MLLGKVDAGIFVSNVKFAKKQGVRFLEEITATESPIAILDISGVPTVDTLIAQHLIKTVNACKLMGTECVISGIRPDTAQTIVQLGIRLENITTVSTMADAIKYGLRKIAG